MPNYYTTPKALKPVNYREYLAQCAAIGRNPLPEHSVTPTGCWALVKPPKPMPTGYIRICRSVNGKQYRLNLHTLSLLHSQAPAIYARIDDMLAQGKRPMACHKPICGGNKTCFNPAHLRLDDNDGNMRDMVRDGVQVRGEANKGGGKLTETQVNAIRAEAAGGATQVALGRKYGVSQTMIGYIVNRTNWAHSDGRLL